MKIIDYRDKQGKFKGKSKIKRAIKWFLILLFLVLIVKAVFSLPRNTSSSIATKTDSELEAIMKEEQFQRETTLRAETVKTTREKDEEEKRHADAVAAENARYEANSGRIEAELQRIRQAEMELGSTSFN